MSYQIFFGGDIMISPGVVLFVCFLLLPAALGLRGHYLDRGNVRKFIRQVKPMALYFKQADAESFISCLIWGAAVLLYFVAGLAYVGVSSVRFLGLTILIMMAVLPVILFVVKFQVIKIVRDNYSWLKWVAGIAAIAVTIFASVYADELIVDATHSRAENFPAAQRVLTAVGALLVYYYLLIFIGFAVYLGQVARVIIKAVMESSGTQEWARGIRVVMRRTPSKRASSKIVMFNEMAMVVGFAFFVLGMIKVAEDNLGSDSMQKIYQKIIVITSFHAKPEDCGLDKDPRVSVSILPLGKMISATALENGKFDFKSGVCNGQ